MKTPFVATSAFAIAIVLSATAYAQPPRGGPGGQGGRGGPPPMNRGVQDNQGFRGNQDANQANANQLDANQNNGQNMPTVEQLAQMMIANFDADGSGGLEQAELQSALTALRQMMQNQNNGQNQGLANQQGDTANAQNQFQRGAFGQNNQGQIARPRRGRP